MTTEEMLAGLRSIIVQASALYQELANAPALTFADDVASAHAYANSELKKITAFRRTAWKV